MTPRSHIAVSQMIRGSPTCADVRYLSLVEGALVQSPDIRDVLSARIAAGLPVEVDHTAISHLLHDGFSPHPRTVYRDVYAISVDLSAERRGEAFIFRRDFPFTNAKSNQSGVTSTRRLVKHLAGAMDAACTGRQPVILSLSSGVDSTSLAIGAKEAGRNDILCVTYGESAEDFEINYARSVCQRLGLRHAAHVFDLGDRSIRDTLRNYASQSAEPCGDPAQIAGISMAARFCEPGGAMLDGSGSDYYFWRPPGRRLDLFKTRLGLGRIAALRHLRPFLPMDFRGERLLASPHELLLLHGAWLRFYETRRFYPDAANTHDYWLQELEHCDFAREEMQHCLKMVYMAPAAYMMKTRNAASAVGAQARFPWADPALAEYCFSLPEQARFDRGRRKSKVIVRQMLTERIAYDHQAVGKRVFTFGKRQFLRNHIDFCREEILDCALWSPRIEAAFNGLATKLERGGRTENALLSLLMVSLWHNHWIRADMRTKLPRRPQAWETHPNAQVTPVNSDGPALRRARMGA